jgi:DNA-directed RNA polymerase subunit M/transcription elongation factor TFIIS
MKKKKLTKKQIIAASREPVKHSRKRIPKNERINKDNQFDYLGIDTWVSTFQGTKKFPSNKITCSECRQNKVSMFGNQLTNYLKKYNNDTRKLLTEFKCRQCRNLDKISREMKEPKPPKEKVEKEKVFLTREEYEARKEEIRKSLPKMDPNYQTEEVDMVKDKNLCSQVTSFACWRPDIFLDHGCGECILQKNCACPIKDINRIPDNRPRKFKRAVTKIAA